MKTFSLCSTLIALILVGCSTNTYQGVSDNAFPRHKLNFLFKESFSLDYSQLKASDWKTLHQINTGAFAKTELIPSEENEMNWQEKITIAYYPKATLPILEGSFNSSLNYAKNQLSKDCLLNNTPMGWSTLKNNEINEVVAHVKWPACSQEGIIRLNKTKNGLNEVTFIKKGNLSPEEIATIQNILEHTLIIEYEN